MTYAYEQYTGISYKNFRGLDSAIKSLAQDLFAVSRKVGRLVDYLCRRAEIDCDYYRDWLKGLSCSELNESYEAFADFAELVILYLTPEKRQRLLSALRECKAL